MQVEFRDGKREVPDHLAALMTDIETYRMTFEEARDAANRKALADLINARADKIVSEHLKERL